MHLFVMSFHLCTYIYKVYICTHTYMKFTLVHLYTLLRPMSMTGKLNEGNSQTKACGQGHMQYMKLFMSTLDKLYFSQNSN